MYNKFKVGDIVVLDTNHPEYSEPHGTAVQLRAAVGPFKVLRAAIPDVPSCIEVESKDGQKIAAFAYRFKLASEPAFKVGDRVRVKAGEGALAFGNAGDTATVVAVGNDRCGLRVRFDQAYGGAEKTCYNHRFELVPEPTFKVGDRVRIGEVPKSWWFRKGWTGRIEHISTPSGQLQVTIDPEFLTVGQGHNRAFVKPEQAELIEDAGSFIVVSVNSAGKLEAAANPFVHPTRTAAETEAKRLSAKVPGKDFRVYSFEHLSTAFTPKPVEPKTQLTKVS